MSESAGWYINEAGKKVEICSAVDAIMFALTYFADDVFNCYEFLTEWSHGTIEGWQAEFDEWKSNRSAVAVTEKKE